MQIVEIKLCGMGPLYHVHPIIKPFLFSRNTSPLKMLENEVLAEPIEIAIIGEAFITIRVNGNEIDDIPHSSVIEEDYFNNMLPIPMSYYLMDIVPIDQTFIIRLNDDEKFEPDKLQFIHSDQCFPFDAEGIIPTEIIYDGKTVLGENYNICPSAKKTLPAEHKEVWYPHLSGC